MPKTWDDLISSGGKFDEGQYPIYASPYTGMILATQYIQQKTGKPFITKDGDLGFTEAQLKEALDFYAELVDKKVIPPVEESVGELSGASSLSESPAFLDGKYAGVHEWSSQVQVYENALKNADNQELAFLGLPTQEGMKDSGVSTKPSLLFAISKTTKHPEETSKLLNFLLNDEEAVKELGLERGVPANTKASKVLDDAGIIDGLAKTANNYVAENMSELPLSPYFEASKVTEAWADLMDSYAYGEISSKEAANQMYEGITQALLETKK
ncbi:extracellular solute-binding protein [Candidatus Enterococcus huntleyi]|uniref:extracellular solute-binding protein n=1 Tax=Candidatus Enterococcus huntleyi TaxID=1857217 RepID=UPI00137A9033|nr:extracellular solute-binding protein [Enterococcus sp. JM4C]